MSIDIKALTSRATTFFSGPFLEFIKGPFLDFLADAFVALIEISVVVVAGAIPFFALVIRSNLGAVEPVNDIWGEAFGNGQLYLYTFAIFGTVVWLTFFDWRYRYNAFRLIMMALVLIMAIYMSSLANFDPTFSKFTDQWVVIVGNYLFAFSLLLYWVLLVFRKEKEAKTSDKVYRKEAREMADGMEGLPK